MEEPFFWVTNDAAFRARVHVGVTVPLLALCLFPFVARMYIRVWPVWRIGWDDALIVVGLVSLAPPGIPVEA
jgi:hypothetical protein